MKYGFSFIDILVSPVTMVIAVILLVFCCWLLIFKRKKLDSIFRILSVIGIVITGIYIAFIIWAVIGFGQP